MANLRESTLDLDKIYDDYMENINETASDNVKESYEALNKDFDNYIAAVTEDSFKKGFRYALALSEKAN